MNFLSVAKVVKKRHGFRFFGKDIFDHCFRSIKSSAFEFRKVIFNRQLNTEFSQFRSFLEDINNFSVYIIVNVLGHTARFYMTFIA